MIACARFAGVKKAQSVAGPARRRRRGHADGVRKATGSTTRTQHRDVPVHRSALQQGDRDTAITNLFSGRPARGIVNRLMRDLGALSGLPPAFPWASQALAPLRTRAESLGRDDFTPLWSGTRPGTFVDRDAATVTRQLAGLH